MKRKYILAISLAIASFAASAAPPVEPGATGEAIYKCYREGYDPPVCQKVASSNDQPNLAELVAATRAARSGKAIRVTKLLAGTTNAQSPIVDCGNGHGQTACCRIIAEVDGILYIECG